MKFNAKIEFLGKHFNIKNINAKDENELKYLIMGKIKFVEISKDKLTDNDVFDFLKGK